ncbi:unnamed protein product [Protopolystoma xenopodis]|uniref:Uncharacterized protein n=1 Tax=Protopolystoma xenopodis TaxID=117903 RepID=A0A3S5ANY9_9PLAT|nr:unnamed protein product [Protopolystoma xenopodis]
MITQLGTCPFSCYARFPKLTEQYFINTRWPSVEMIVPLVGDDRYFLMLYRELYYRHIYAHNTTGLSVDDMRNSFANYCSLFAELLDASKPLLLELPCQWLWDIIDEFIYQFQKFTIFRSRSKHKPDEEALLKENHKVWSIHSVLNILHKLVEKSNINEQLQYYATSSDPDLVAGEFGSCPVYKMLGFFSLIGLCRLHVLLGDYFKALRFLKHIDLSRIVSF